jgi:hypothetical protein
MEASPKKNSIELRERDYRILLELFESRAMTISHLAYLHFDGRFDAARKRIQKLKRASLIAERPRKSTEPAVYQLPVDAIRLLAAEGRLTSYPALTIAQFAKRANVSNATIEHELAVADAKVAISRAIGNLAGVSVEEFSTWPRLHEFKVLDAVGNTVPVRPDGFLRIRERSGEHLFEHACFLEIDRSTETQHRLMAKAACYAEHYRSGNYAISCGGRPEQFKVYPFRVLIVFKTLERRNNAAESFLRGRSRMETQVWLTTDAELQENPLGPIWIRPRDYLRVTINTPYDPEARRPHGTYRRNRSRDEFVEAAIRKWPLLADMTD